MRDVAEIDRRLREWVERKEDDLRTLIGCCNDVALCKTEIARLIELRNEAGTL